LHADYAFTLLTYAFAFSNLAHVIVDSVGNYEQDRAITEAERQAKEEKVNVAVDFLCRASGIFTFLSDTLLPEWETSRVSPPNFHRPPDLTREVSNSLAKFVASSCFDGLCVYCFPLSRMALADAQTLAIRRLMSKSTYDSNVTPGPPLPASHRPPSLLAKLHIECASLYSSARTLAMTLGSSKSSSKESANKEVSSDLRRYLGDQATFHSAMAHSWLGVDAGEKGGTDKGGEAVAFLQWARKELEELKDGGKLVSIGATEKEKTDKRKDKINSELARINLFYQYYKKMNDTVCIPSFFFCDFSIYSSDCRSYTSSQFRHSRIYNLGSLAAESQFLLNPMFHSSPLLVLDRSNTRIVKRSHVPCLEWVILHLNSRPHLRGITQAQELTFEF
jgi:hypothetical protein